MLVTLVCMCTVCVELSKVMCCLCVQLLAQDSSSGKSSDPTVWLDRLAVIFRLDSQPLHQCALCQSSLFVKCFIGL